MEQLLDYAKDGFKTVKGNVNKELTEKHKILNNTYYKTNYLLEGTIENYVEEDGSSWSLSFKASFAKDLSFYESDKLFKNLSQQLKLGFATGFIIKEYFDSKDGDTYKTVRVQRNDDKTHYIELAFIDGDSPAGDYSEVYITVK